MKNVKQLLMLTAALALLAATPTALQAAAGISGTKHDLSVKGWGTDELCIFCHTPHNSDTTVKDAPLWNHKVTSTVAFKVYDATVSPTLNAVVGSPSSSSKLCLSCHDGTVAMDSFGGKSGTQPPMTGTNVVGTDLSNDHPISFLYDAKLAGDDGALVSPTSASKVDALGKVPLFAGKVECASCHQVHNNEFPPFLRMANTGSALCLKCHIK
jgi:predicted CXXCH cytochrome family protein